MKILWVLVLSLISVVAFASSDTVAAKAPTKKVLSSNTKTVDARMTLQRPERTQQVARKERPQ